MAALIAMPVVGFLLLMAMALYEDRMLPRNAGAASPEREPGERSRPAFGLVTDPGPARKPNNCRARRADARPVRRSHAPVPQDLGQGVSGARSGPASPAEMADTVPYPVPGPLPDVPGDVA